MIRYIWKNWWRHPERFLLLLVGMLIISSTLSYFVGVTESNNGTTQEILQKRWKAAYHIVVRPEGTRSVTEQDQLLEPNYLNGLYGGISLDDYAWIKSLPDVEVAAPLAPIGYLGTTFTYGKVIEKPKEPGIYRHVMVTYSNDGVHVIPSVERIRYYTNGLWSMPGDEEETRRLYGVESWILDLWGFFNQLLVGIDPVEEARLVGLDQAVMPIGESSYFTEKDKAETDDAGEGQKVTKLPILMSNRIDADFSFVSRYERLKLPFSTREEADQTMKEVASKGGASYLDQLETEGEPIEYAFGSKEAHALLFASLSGVDSQTGKPFLRYQNNNRWAYMSNTLNDKPGPLAFEKTASPYPERWNYAYGVKAVKPEIPKDIQEFYGYMPDDFRYSFRPFRFVDNWNWSHLIEPYWVGFYDPEKLAISKEPIDELPMETYRPAEARLVLDKDGRPVNPPVSVRPSLNPFGLLTNPPLMLTTIDAAAQLMGDKPIASIRIKVKGVEGVSEASQQKLEEVAREIEQRTGLIADITLGSSPQPVLVHVPANGSYPAMGWIEQFFVKLGSVFTLFREVSLGFSGIMGIVMLMAVTYVFATNLVTLYARTNEFGLWLAVGWHPGHVAGILFLEACLLGGIVTLISWAIVGTIVLQQGANVPLGRVIGIGLFGIVIYVLAAIPAAFFVSRVSPLVLMRSGELKPGSRRLIRVQSSFSLALGQLLLRFRRSLLSVFAIAVPTGLLVFFGFVTFRLQGMMYTSWLGQYVAVEIGQEHYVAMVLALVIAVLTTAEIIWQNVMDRKAELLLLKAMGWRNGAIFRLILSEGLLCGLLAAIGGIGLGVLVIAVLYRQFPAEDMWLLLSAGLIPVLVGVLGAIFPAVMAVRFRPAEGLRGSQKNRRRTERVLRVMMAVLLIGSVAGATVSAVRLWQASSTEQGAAPGQAPGEQPVPSANPDPAQGGSNQGKEGTGTPPKQEKAAGDLTGFAPEPVPEGSKASYQLSFRMDKSGRFAAKADIQVENLSKDNWDQLVFYFIPNVFTKQNKPEAVKGTADVSIDKVELDQKQAAYQLSSDTLAIPLDKKMAPGEVRTVHVSYSFTVPEEGLRFDKMGQRYFLAQAYPMLATYRNGWNKQEYRINGESYHTGYSDFTVSYDLPPGYQFVSSSDEDPAEARQSGEVAIPRVREAFAAVVKDVTSISETVDGVQIRVIGEEANRQKMEEALRTAAEAVPFFSEKIGKYPHKQLDILLDGRVDMEYPGVVAVAANKTGSSLEHTVVHEIGHQWFYGMIANDAYHDRWLDEGLTELASAMFFLDYRKQSEDEVFAAMKQAARAAVDKPSNLPLDQYEGETYAYFYSVPPLRLWELISTYGTAEDGWRFLKAYCERYSYQEVDTKEFVRFATAYFPVTETYFAEWLKL
jgi:hypothetical protein